MDAIDDHGGPMHPEAIELRGEEQRLLELHSLRRGDDDKCTGRISEELVHIHRPPAKAVEQLAEQTEERVQIVEQPGSRDPPQYGERDPAAWIA